MRAHYLQHVPFEGLGSIEPWLKAAGSAITGTRFFESTRLPDPDGFDLLIIMGGPMSVNDGHEFPWLESEKRFIRDSVRAGKAVLGICLGAQLIVNALGARVYQAPCREIGWFPVQGLPCPDRSVFTFPASVEVFHWHGETFELPSRAIRLATGEGCENQAFQLGDSVIGLQFHLETTPESARDLITHCRDELVPAAYIQTETELLAAPPGKYRIINKLMADVLSFLCNKLPTGGRRAND